MLFKIMSGMKKRKDEESPLLNDCLHEKFKTAFSCDMQCLSHNAIALFPEYI
jgi:hypothetical protein